MSILLILRDKSDDLVGAAEFDDEEAANAEGYWYIDNDPEVWSFDIIIVEAA
jgi:hypothetical protein